MTVTELRQRRAETEQALSTLAERIELAVENSIATIALETARAMANEAGLHRFQDMLLDALDQLDAARSRKRKAVAALDQAKSDYDSAVAEAEWALNGNFETRSNKSWLARNLDGTAIPEDEQRSMTADERRDWITRAAARVPAVAKAKRELDAVTEHIAQANDEIAMAERGAKAAEHLLDAAREELVLLATALRAPARAGTTQNGAR